MISSVCSQWTIPMSPSLQWLEQSPGSTISVWVLTEEGLRVCPGTNDFKWVGPCSLLCLECLIDLETSLSTIRGIWSCPFSLKPSALQPLGHPSPGPDLFGSFLHWGVQELVALYFCEARFFLTLSSYRFHLVSEMVFGCGTFRVTAQLSDWLVNESVGCVGL